MDRNFCIGLEGDCDISIRSILEVANSEGLQGIYESAAIKFRISIFQLMVWAYQVDQIAFSSEFSNRLKILILKQILF